MELALLFDREALYQTLKRRGLPTWAQHLRDLCQSRLIPEAHGNMPAWIDAYHRLPTAEPTTWDATGAAVSVGGPTTVADDVLTETLRAFHPWRKGPFQIFSIDIDTEWRSDLKWERIVSAIDFRDKLVLDVGCGNGYYGWRMLEAGAELVIGCDPFPLYWMQFEVLRRYAPRPERHHLVPLSDDDLLPSPSPFDVTLSMGVLYHRHDPQQHLERLRGTLAPGGQLLLETLIIEADSPTSLEPVGRYAKMKNIGAIPSLPLLTTWLEQCGFQDIQVVDISRTTAVEQRRTPWMTFESLVDFLDPEDHTRTIEGHPAPVRAVLSARRPISSRHKP